MARKEFIYRGKTIDEIKAMSLNEFAELLPSRSRRSIKRGFTDAQKILLKNLENKSTVKTHCRDIVIVPAMLEKTIMIHRGNKFEAIKIEPEMLGHFLGEFALSRKRVMHSSPGVGATKSSSSISVR